MSPYKAKNENSKSNVPTIASNDQLKMILKGLGKMKSGSDLSFVTSEYALKYISELEATIDHSEDPALKKSIQLLRNKVKFEDLADIIHNLLNFNPYFRKTAWECLRDPVFDSIRDTNKESILRKMNSNCQI